jgi:hypothetical protein
MGVRLLVPRTGQALSFSKVSVSAGTAIVYQESEENSQFSRKWLFFARFAMLLSGCCALLCPNGPTLTGFRSGGYAIQCMD